MMATREVWGFTVRESAAGKNIWPNGLKLEACRRIREDGNSAGDIAAEIGAHECLVRKWSVADRRSRGEKIVVEGPAFAQVDGQAFASLTVEDETPKGGHSFADERVGQFGRILCGGVTIEFPLEISEAKLTKLIQVADRFQ